MARRVVVMDEILEVIYQWHNRQNNCEISRSIGIDQNADQHIITLPLPNAVVFAQTFNTNGGIHSSWLIADSS